MVLSGLAISRRSTFKIVGSVAAVHASGARASLTTRSDDPYSALSLHDSLERYEAAGLKHSGGSGDEATGAWLADVLASSGFRPWEAGSKPFDVPFFKPGEQFIELIGGVRVPVFAQSVVVQTMDGGLDAPLIVRYSSRDDVRLPGAIVLINLPSERRGDINSVTPLIQTCHAAGAAAVLLVTNGPAGEAQMLNSPGNAPVVPIPICVLSPKDAAPFLAAGLAGARARLVVTGEQGRRPARNVVGVIDRGKREWVVITTPRSGWTHCAAERGPGVAIWVALARTALKNLPNHNLMFAALSGHEHHGPGTTLLIESAPPPASTALWVHLGGNLASRDWHETGIQLIPLPTVDPQRYIMGTDAFLPKLRAAFKGVSGLEQPYSANGRLIGDYVEIYNKGYVRSFAGFGVTRFHHTVPDRLDAQTSGILTEPAARGFDRAIRSLTA